MTAAPVRPPVLAARTRKARRDSACALCPHRVITGQRIGLLPGRGWAHVSCVIAARPAVRAEGA